MAKLVLQRHFAGKTVKLGHFQFINGELELKGGLVENEGIIRYLHKCYEAKLVATEEEKNDGQHDIQTSSEQREPAEVRGNHGQAGSEPAKKEAVDVGGNDDDKAGAKGDVAGGHGHQDSWLHSKIKEAVKHLDAENDSHWTKDGKPACDAVADLMNSGNVTRGQIDQACPGLVRKLKAS